MPQKQQYTPEQIERFNTDWAITEFRNVERYRFLLALAEHRLDQRMRGPITRDRYFEVTERYLREYEERRADAVKSKKLPG